MFSTNFSKISAVLHKMKFSKNRRWQDGRQYGGHVVKRPLPLQQFLIKT